MAKSVSSSVLKGRWMVWMLALFFALIAGIGTLLIVGKAASRVSYFVVATDVPARTQITPNLVVEIPVTEDALPPTALTEAEIASGAAFTRVPLRQGDVVTGSVAGPLQKITYTLPEGYVAASVSLPPERAVAGKVKAGDYIDIAAVDGSKSKIVLQHVLVLDVTISPDSIGSAANADPNDPNLQPGPEAAQVRGGIPQVYTVALSQEDFAVLALVSGGVLQIALSPEVEPGELVPPVDASADLGNVFNDAPVASSGEGTDSVFGDDNSSDANEPAAPTSPSNAPQPLPESALPENFEQEANGIAPEEDTE
jgi:Flp pilus assembly protein CpaB